jgi:hypothetical protein
VVVEVVLRWVAVDRLVEEVIEAEVNSMDIVSVCFLNVVGEKAKCCLGSQLLLTRGSGDVGRRRHGRGNCV